MVKENQGFASLGVVLENGGVEVGIAVRAGRLTSPIRLSCASRWRVGW